MLWPLLGSAEDGIQKRPITVAESIETSVIGDSGFEYMDGDGLLLSPDTKHVAVISRRGNLASNTYDYTLLCFDTQEALNGGGARVVISHRSSTNMPGITLAKWINDHTLVFLAEDGSNVSQVFSLDTRIGKETQLTHHPTDILDFDISPDLETIAYMAVAPVRDLISASTSGLIVDNQFLDHLLAGHTPQGIQSVSTGYPYAHEMFTFRRGALIQVKLPADNYPSPIGGIFLSPDARHAIINTEVPVSYVPQIWRRYPDVGNGAAWAEVYQLINVETGSSQLLIDAPAIVHSRESIQWTSEDSVVVSGTYLPPQSESGADVWRTQFVVEVNLSSHKEIVIAREPRERGAFPGVYLKSWDDNRKVLTIMPPEQELGEDGKPEAYQKVGDRWERRPSDSKQASPQIEVVKQEDMNSPPRIIVHDSRSGRSRIIFDPNPQFNDLQFAKVEEITWNSDGHSFKGGLFLPINYIAGKKYPLVIQTHGWDPKEFAIDGLHSGAGYAAQALTAKGMIVVQMDETSYDFDSNREGAANTRLFETLVDYLNERGLIDKDRVGLFGWSRTGYHLRYALAFSRYPFAAAEISDGEDAGFPSFMEWAYLGPWAVNYKNVLNGGDPLRGGLPSWIEHEPTFHLANVTAPVRLLAFGSINLAGMWHWYSGLKYLDKPVEFEWLPTALHSPVKPLERMTSQGGTVDWFDFWLNGHEDPDPAKQAEYVRWRKLREMHEADLKAVHSGDVSKDARKH